MPKKGRPTILKSTTTEDNNLKNIIENLDEKTRRKVDYLLRDFRLQRQERLESIEDKKLHYFNIIDAYFTKIPKLVPSRYTLMKNANFELSQASVTIDFKKFLGSATLSNLKSKKDVLKFGGTPAKFKVIYSATKRKSIARNEIKHFELKRLSENGSKTIISSAKKSVLNSVNKNKLIKTISRLAHEAKSNNNSNNSSDYQQIENSLEEEKQLKNKMKTFQLSKIKESENQLNKIKDKQLNLIDNLFKNILNSLTEEQAKQKITINEQNKIIQQIYGF